MAANLALVQAKVQRILAGAYTGVSLWKSGFTLSYESAAIFIEIIEQTERVMISMTCPVLTGCEPTPELFHHVAVHGDDYFLGHLSATEYEGKVSIYLTHSLLGDYLDDAELTGAVSAMLGSANTIDDELQKSFGGKRYNES